jgi:hypothetical protein
LPIMNSVRLFGFDQTAGIDDDDDTDMDDKNTTPTKKEA